MQRRLRAKTLQGAIEKSSIIISHFWGTNNTWDPGQQNL